MTGFASLAMVNLDCAGKPECQPGGDRWRVLTDPAGHPCCICARRE